MTMNRKPTMGYCVEIVKEDLSDFDITVSFDELAQYKTEYHITGSDWAAKSNSDTLGPPQFLQIYFSRKTWTHWATLGCPS